MAISATHSYPVTHAPSRSSAEQAQRILHIGFIAAPLLAGLDKFFNVLADWTVYVPQAIAGMIPFGVETFMMIVGVIEIAAGVLVAMRPKIGAIVVAAWLALIIINLLILGTFLDVALRDLGLMLAAIALSKLSDH